jgi:hypothetical protein
VEHSHAGPVDRVPRLKVAHRPRHHERPSRGRLGRRRAPARPSGGSDFAPQAVDLPPRARRLRGRHEPRIGAGLGADAVARQARVGHSGILHRHDGIRHGRVGRIARLTRTARGDEGNDTYATSCAWAWLRPWLARRSRRRLFGPFQLGGGRRSRSAFMAPHFEHLMIRSSSCRLLGFLMSSTSRHEASHLGQATCAAGSCAKVFPASIHR